VSTVHLCVFPAPVDTSFSTQLASAHVLLFTTTMNLHVSVKLARFLAATALLQRAV
jgi:hypothetical protein